MAGQSVTACRTACSTAGSRAALLGELPQRGGGAVEILGIARRQVVGRHMRIELANDLHQRLGSHGIGPIGRQAGDGFDERALALFLLMLHRASPTVVLLVEYPGRDRPNRGVT